MNPEASAALPATEAPAAKSSPPPSLAQQLEARLVELVSELVSFLQHHTGDHHLGADLAQDVMARAFASLGSLRDPEAMRGWVFRIAVNRFNDHVRRARTVRIETGSLPEREAPETKRPEREAMASELDVVLRRELLKLPERQRTVLMLHGVKGLDQRQIAELLDITVDAVKMSLFHAREKMRNRLGNYLEHVPSKRRQR